MEKSKPTLHRIYIIQADPYGPACVLILSEKYRVSVRRFISRLKLFLDASQAVACVVVLFQLGHYFLGRFQRELVHQHFALDTEGVNIV